jgi:hypothetical protein
MVCVQPIYATSDQRAQRMAEDQFVQDLDTGFREMGRQIHSDWPGRSWDEIGKV